MIGILIALVSAIFMTGMQIMLKKSYKELNPSVAYLFDMLFGLIIWIPIGFLFGATIEKVLDCILYAIISAILSEALVFYALSKGNLSITTVLISTYPIYTVIFSLLINNEKLLPLQVILILITIIGTVLTSFDSQFKIKKIMNLQIIVPCITAIAIGLSDTLTKKIINRTSSYNFIVAIAIVQIPIAIIFLMITKQRIRTVLQSLKEGMKEYKYSIIGSMLNVIATGCLLISFNYTYASIASPLTAIYTPIVLIYSFAVLKERINKINLCGIILALIGTFGIIIMG